MRVSEHSSASAAKVSSNLPTPLSRMGVPESGFAGPGRWGVFTQYQLFRCRCWVEFPDVPIEQGQPLLERESSQLAAGLFAQAARHLDRIKSLGRRTRH